MAEVLLILRLLQDSTVILRHEKLFKLCNLFSFFSTCSIPYTTPLFPRKDFTKIPRRVKLSKKEVKMRSGASYSLFSF